MSLAITHFAVGGTLTTLVLLYLLPPTRYARSLVLVGGLWAMVPDVHRISPVFATQLRAFHGSTIADAFWLHRTLDAVDPGDSTLVATVALGTFTATAVVADRWSYTTRERAASPDGSPLGVLRSVVAVGRLASVAGVGLGVGYLGLAVGHPATDASTGLYVGVGAILLATGLLGATTELAVAGAVTRLTPAPVRLVFRAAVAVGAVTVGLGLLAVPLRSGPSAASVAYAGLGSALLLEAVVFAGAWVDADGPARSVERDGR